VAEELLLRTARLAGNCGVDSAGLSAVRLPRRVEAAGLQLSASGGEAGGAMTEETGEPARALTGEELVDAARILLDGFWPGWAIIASRNAADRASVRRLMLNPGS